MSNLAVFWKGLRFGMLLQLAVGPVCLMVLRSSAQYGFISGLSLVAAAALVDALYIFLSGLGMAALVGRAKVKRGVKLFGFCTLLLFGADLLGGAFGFGLLPGVSLFGQVTTQNLFWQGVLLTASNPLTILFWGGVFSTQAAQNNFGRVQLALFGVGCVAATGCFLTGVALVGSFAGGALPPELLRWFNAGVGAALIWMAFRLLTKPD